MKKESDESIEEVAVFGYLVVASLAPIFKDARVDDTFGEVVVESKPMFHLNNSLYLIKDPMR